MTGCFIVDIGTNGKALLELKPIILKNIQHRQGVDLDAVAGKEYTAEEKGAVQVLLSALLADDDKSLIENIFLLLQYPRSFALLTRYINAPGCYPNAEEKGLGRQTPPPNCVILHREMGAESQLSLQTRAWGYQNRNSDNELSRADLIFLQRAFLQQIQDLPHVPFSTLYIGGGHGGDFNGRSNLRTQMSGIDAECWQKVFGVLQTKGISANLIVAESCYSAAYSAEFKSILSAKGLCLCNILECTPYDGLLASCVTDVLNEKNAAPLLAPQLIIPSEIVARIILDKCCAPQTHFDQYLKSVIEELSNILPTIIFDAKQQFTVEALTTADTPVLQTLFRLANLFEVTCEQLEKIHPLLLKATPESKRVDIWDYYNPTTLAPRKVDSVEQMRLAIQAKLQPIHSMMDARRLAAAYSHIVVAFTAEYARLKTPESRAQFLVRNQINTQGVFLLTPQLIEKATNYNFDKKLPIARLVKKRGDTLVSLMKRLNNSFLDTTTKCFMSKHYGFVPATKDTPPANASAEGWMSRRDSQLETMRRAYAGAVHELSNARLLSIMGSFSLVSSACRLAPEPQQQPSIVAPT